ncbi:hypothetical protein [Hymenobacter sp.]|uniref:hypothetical protein n=1 Tax=Hymenobacter sp. TaxID=1898978 RepID=UPI002EDBB0DE
MLRRQRQTGSLAAKPVNGGPARCLSAEDQAWLVAYVQEHPDGTLAELGHAWQHYSGRVVGQTCLWQVLAEHGLRRKKSLHASERDTPRVAQTREKYRQTEQVRPATARFHFLDETGLRLEYTRRYVGAAA